MHSVSYDLNKWIKSKWRKNTRFYVLNLCQNIFGAWIITKTWGSAINKGFGQSQDIQCSDYQQGMKMYQKLEERRLHRGYEKLS